MEGFWDGAGLALWAAGIWVFLQILRFFLVFQVVLKTELRSIRPGPIAPQALPPELAQVLQVGVDRLQALGFELLGVLESERAQVIGETEEPSYLVVLQHEPSGSYATLSLAEEADPTDPYSVHFVTEGADGRTVITGNAVAHSVIAPHPNNVFQDPLALDLGGQWQAHQARVQVDQLGPGQTTDLAGFGLATGRRLDESLAHAVARGVLKEPRPGRFVPGWRAAARFSVQLIKSGTQLAKYKRDRAERTEAAAAQVELPLALVAAAYGRQKRLMARQTPRSFLGWIFAITGLLFVASFMPLTGGLFGALILLVVVLFHELGHYLAMRAFGFADTTIFFLPFLGAATTGKKDNASASEEMIVLLAGPVPGLMLGLLLSALPLPRSELLDLSASTLILLNALNLVPIYPFDGGRIAHLLVFGRTVASDIVFQILGAALLLAAAYASGSGVMMVPAALIVLALPSVVRIARIAKRVEPSEPRDEAVLKAIDSVVGPQLSFAQKVNLGRAVEKRLGGRPAGLFGTLAWGTAYGLIVTASLAGAVRYFGRPPPPTEERLPLPDDPDRPLKTHNCDLPERDRLSGDDEPRLLRFRCYGDAAIRARLDAAFDGYFESPRTLWVPPPWLPNLAEDTKFEGARQSLAAMVRERRRLRDEEVSGWALLRERLEPLYFEPDEIEARMIRRTNARLEELEARTIDEAEDRGEAIDRRVAHAFASHLLSISASGRASGDPAALWQILGGPPLPSETATGTPSQVTEYGTLWGFSLDREDRLDLMLAPNHPDSVLWAMESYLCRAGCERLEWREN